MPVFLNVDGKLKKLSLVSLDKEKALQKLVEDNLLEVLDIRFLASEYQTTNGGRIDTLAIDSDGAPVIIEYKRSRNDSVINQALSYLKWLKAQKKEFFEMLVLKKLGTPYVAEIDWLNPRIICIAESYSKFDIDSLEVIPLRLELYKFHYYQNNLFVLDRINGDDEKPGNNSNAISEKVNTKISEHHGEKILITKSTSTDLDKISKHNLEKQLNRGQHAIKSLFGILQKKILEFDESIYEKINTNNVAFRISKMFAEVHIQKDNIIIYLRPIEYNDPVGMIFKVPDTHRWTLNRGVRIKNESELHYIMSFIEQSYKDIL